MYICFTENTFCRTKLHYKRFKNLLLFNMISFPSNSSAKVGKLSVGRQRRLKSEFSLFKLSLFSDFNSKFNSELEEIFLKMSYKIADFSRVHKVSHVENGSRKYASAVKIGNTNQFGWHQSIQVKCCWHY